MESEMVYEALMAQRARYSSNIERIKAMKKQQRVLKEMAKQRSEEKALRRFNEALEDALLNRRDTFVIDHETYTGVSGSVLGNQYMSFSPISSESDGRGAKVKILY